MNVRYSRPVALPAAMSACVLAGLLAASAQAADDAPQESDNEQAETTAEDEAIKVPILVEAQEIAVQPGHVRFDADFIQRLPGGEAHLADVLRANPAVDFGRESDLSRNSAVLRPGEISIHGQPFYQNAFLIDGIDTANDLNPAAATDLWSIPSLTRPNGGSSPQAYYLDTNLIESVEVYDSNVPAEYGGFTGGVVDTELKRYSGENLVSLGYSLRRDEWEQFHVTEDDLTASDYYSARYTPDYRKSSLSLAVLRGVGDLGVSLSASRRLSTFAQRYEKRNAARQEERHLDYEDAIDNVLGRIDTNLGATAVGVSFRHSTRRHDGLTSTTYDGRLKKDHDGNGLTLSLERAVGEGKLELDIGYDRVRDILDSDGNTLPSTSRRRPAPRTTIKMGRSATIGSRNRDCR